MVEKEIGWKLEDENWIRTGNPTPNLQFLITLFTEVKMLDNTQSIDIIEIFCSYSHKDEEWKNKLETHLSGLRRQQLIAVWSDRKIEAGTEWKGQIDDHLNNAEIILLLISADFVNSDYCYDIEMKRALERYDRREARVIPISVRPVDWEGLPFAKLQALPKDAKPITTWANQDEAFVDVTKGIRETVFLIKQATKAPPTPSVVFRSALTEPMGQWSLGLNVTVEKIDGTTLKSILDCLRPITGKAKLILQRIEGEPGTLMLMSAHSTFQKIQAQANQIVLPNGIRIEKMEWKSGRIVR